MPEDTAGLTDPQQIRVEMIKLRVLRKRRIDPEKGCWIWTGTAIKGAGIIKLGRTRVLVHRLAIALWRGIVLKPTQLAVRTCGTERCFHPDHREIQTKAEVRRRAFLKSATEADEQKS
ncbi:MAG TPA: hypothetical protein VIH67_04855 [Candidatus Acidoferrum sp.]